MLEIFLMIVRLELVFSFKSANQERIMFEEISFDEETW
jgi:hypothetical protein